MDCFGRILYCVHSTQYSLLVYEMHSVEETSNSIYIDRIQRIAIVNINMVSIYRTLNYIDELLVTHLAKVFKFWELHPYLWSD